MIKAIVLLLILSLLPQQQTTAHTLTFDGIERHYRLYVPSNYDPNVPVPLVLALHGGSGNAINMIRLTQGGFNTLADEQGFIVVYPEGIRRYWNDGRDLPRRYSDADDVGFFRALIEQLTSEYSINRVYSTGISNGGFMSFRLACELSDQITAIAPVVGLMSTALAENCAPEHPVGVLLIAGTDDPLVPYAGGDLQVSSLQRGEVLSAEDSIRFWAEANKCDSEPTTVDLPDPDPDDGTRVYQTAYHNCAAPVTLLTIEGGGHTWAGGWQYLGEGIVGKASRDIDANQVIWDFVGQTR